MRNYPGVPAIRPAGRGGLHIGCRKAWPYAAHQAFTGRPAIVAAFALSFSFSSPAARADNAAPTPSPMATPAMSYPLAANPYPDSFSAGPLGKLYVTGVVSGLALWQDNPIPSPSATGNRHATVDLSNGQVFIQKTDGIVQFFIQAGGYSLPAVGSAYIASGKATDNFYGVLPQAYVKIAPTGNFSVLVGKLPTLIGAEYTFTFENPNIERGLLWNQENAVNRGIQANYSTGPVSLSVSWNDGYYSDRFNWIYASATYTINASNSLSLVGGGNLGHTGKSTLATPLLQDNSDIFNVIYTHTSGPWTIQPYLQYTYVPTNSQVGITKAASTLGGALLGNYAFNSSFSLAARAEYITSRGSPTDGTPNLLYGAGSSAWSVTVTPTYQRQAFFARAEFSYVKANGTTAGSVFGPAGNNTSQARFLLETGFLF